MLIRKYNEKDIPYINKLGSLLHDNYIFSLDDFSDCLVIEVDRKIIGFIIYSEIYERAEIVDIIIEPAYRNKGYAKSLIKRFLDVLNKSVNNVTLEVNSSNINAINLYKKLGFEIVAIRKKYYDGKDGYLMKKDLR